MDQQSLHAWEARCIQEEAPRCTAACPLHVDARKLCDLMAKGRWNDAWAVLVRTMPLPGVLARICDAPCENACLREERGGAVRIGTLERICASKATRTPPLLPLPAKGKTAGVLGAGLAGLSAAWELARKGFSVTVYGTPPQGRLANLPEETLPAAALQADLDRLRSFGVTFLDADSTNAGNTAEELNVFIDRHDTLFLDPEIWPSTMHGYGGADTLTLGTDRPGLFSGDISENGGPPSPVMLASLGRRAANSMERFVQRASLVAGREKDGPYESLLYTNISEVEDLPPVILDAEGSNETDVKAEANRCLRCECLECVKNCVYLKHYGSYPKVYARRIHNNDSIVMGTRKFNTIVNSCMDCGLCSTLCPESFDMGALCLEARQSLVRQGKMPPSAHEFALRDMAFANSDKCMLIKPAPGQTSASLLFFPGCQLTASDPDVVQRAYAWLREKRPDAGLHLACCGAPALWAGRVNEYEAVVSALREQWATLGSPEIVAACPTCLKTLAEILPEAPIRSFWGVMHELGLPEGAHVPPVPLAVHDPCGSRDDSALHEDVRSLLQTMHTQTVEPKLTREHTECCGYGGLLCEVDPALAASVSEHRAQAAEDDFITYCAMCRDRLARTGKRILHLFDVLFPAPGNADPANRPAPGYSDRRENRVRLKDSLLATLWKEESPEPEPFTTIHVRFAGDAAERLDDRRILLSDIQKTLLAVQQERKSFISAQTGHHLARHRPANVTYWVEYEPDGDGFLVHNAWSHRMRVAGIEGGDR